MSWLVYVSLCVFLCCFVVFRAGGFIRGALVALWRVDVYKGLKFGGREVWGS